MNPTTEPLLLAQAIRFDGYHDAADCIERLYRACIELATANLAQTSRASERIRSLVTDSVNILEPQTILNAHLAKIRAARENSTSRSD